MIHKFKSGEFPWEEIGENKYQCSMGVYTLTIEEMGAKHWTWKLFKETYIMPENPEHTICRSKYLAIGRCEGAYLIHKTLFT